MRPSRPPSPGRSPAAPPPPPRRRPAVGAGPRGAPAPARHEAFLTAFTGAEPQSPDSDDLSYPLADAHLHVLTPDDAAEIYGSVEAELDQPSFVAFGVRVEDIGLQASWLDAAEISYPHIGSRPVVRARA